MAQITSQTRSFSTSTTLSTNSLSLVRSNSYPTLENLNLGHILNGETCPPISFPDFAAFITHKEFSAENLLFAIWFRSYRARYEALQESLKIGVPIPSTRLGDRFAPFAYVDKAMEERVHDTPEQQVGRGDVVFDIPFEEHPDSPSKKKKRREPRPVPVPAQHNFSRCEWTKDGKRACECGHHPSSTPAKTIFSFRTKQTSAPETKPILHHNSQHPTLPPFGTMFTEPADQPMREEAERAFSTFLRKGGSRELGVSDDLRQFTRTCLKRSTAPEVFLPLYEEVYQVIETQSLPHFLSYAKTNINRPKQIFWYIVGFTDFCIGLAIYLILTFVLSNQHFALRATRLPSALFISFGAMQAYSAWRGFCTQVWGRSSRQIRPWEMDDVFDEEADVRGAGIDIRGTGTMLGFPAGGGFSPTGDKEMAFDLPEEVHPLTDLSSIIATPAPTSALAPWERPMFPGLEVLEVDDELSEKAQKQLQIRRATIGVPDANLVFPIAENSISTSKPLESPLNDMSFGSPRQQRTSREINRTEISPFDTEPATVSTRAAGPSSPTRSLSNSTTLPVVSPPPQQATIVSPPTTPDLTSLLVKFRRSEPKDPENFASTASKREKKVAKFGPEKLIEDPRVKKMHDAVVRDILTVGGFIAVIWVILCLAIPMKGS